MSRNSRWIRFPLVTLAVITAMNLKLQAQTPLGSAFTYQGQLFSGGTAVNDTADFQFGLWDAATGGNAIGMVVSVSSVEVVDGLFTVELDFGDDALNVDARWLEIDVRSPAGAGGYTTLSPRQPLTAVPYASQTRGLRIDTDSNVTAGPLNGNTASGGSATVAGGQFNSASDLAATVGGGDSNLASDRFATVAGGTLNVAGGEGAAVGGGSVCSAKGEHATVPGGLSNSAGGNYSLAAGKQARVRDAAASGDVDGDEGTFVWADTSGGDFTSTGPNQFLIRAQGGVGINKTNPGTTLDVNGTVTANAFVGDGSGLSNLPVMEGKWSDGVNGNIYYNDGKVGIGTDTPERYLHISGDVIKIERAANSPAVLLTNTLNGVLDAQFGLFNTGADTGYTYLSDEHSNRLVYITEGKVGIGTNSPQAKMHVAGTVNVDDGIRIDTRPQVIDQSSTSPMASTVGSTDEWQSFTPGVSGDLAAVELVRVPGGSAGTLTVYVGEGTGGSVLAMASVSAATLLGLQEVVLEQMPALTAGQKYTIQLQTTTNMEWAFVDPGAYAGGRASVNPAWDFLFRTKMLLPGETTMIVSDSRVGIGRDASVNTLEVEGNASKTTAGSWLANSDRRIKTDIETVTSALDTIDRVRLVSFKYTDDYKKSHPGIGDGRYLNVIAQEFAEVFPDHVKGSGEHLPDGSEILQVDTYPLTIYSAAAIQELRVKMDRQLAMKDAEIESLNQRIARLESLVRDRSTR